MKHLRYFVIPTMLCAALAAACASAPREPVAEANTAAVLIQQADSAGAGQYAPAPLANARAELVRSHGLSEKGKTEEAISAAELATGSAKLALASTERAKSEKAAAEANAANQALRTETTRPQPAN
jgi:Domain of unknown function (DUF4398)